MHFHQSLKESKQAMLALMIITLGQFSNFI